MEQWQYRRKFWLSYYEENRIDDAYVILGKQAIEHMQSKEDDNIINYENLHLVLVSQEIEVFCFLR